MRGNKACDHNMFSPLSTKPSSSFITCECVDLIQRHAISMLLSYFVHENVTFIGVCITQKTLRLW